MQAFTLDVIHDEVDILWRVDGFIQLDYACMIESAQDSDFTDCLLLPLDIRQLQPIVLLDGHMLSTRLMNAFLDDCICTGTNNFPELVRVQIGAVRRREFIEVL